MFRLVPVNWNPMLFTMETVPVTVVVPVPADWMYPFTAIFPIETLFAVLIVRRFGRLVALLPTAPPKVILPVPAASVRFCVSAEAPFTVPEKEMLPPVDPVEMVELLFNTTAVGKATGVLVEVMFPPTFKRVVGVKVILLAIKLLLRVIVAPERDAEANSPFPARPMAPTEIFPAPLARVKVRPLLVPARIEEVVINPPPELSVRLEVAPTLIVPFWKVSAPPFEEIVVKAPLLILN